MLKTFLNRSDFISIFKIISSFEWKGFIREGDSSFSSEQTAYWEQLGFDIERLKRVLSEKSIQIHTVGNVEDTVLKNICVETGIRISTDPSSITIVITDDYSHNSLKELNKKFIKEKKTWLMVQPTGVETMIGPIFVPGQTACWECLHHRLMINQPF